MSIFTDLDELLQIYIEDKFKIQEMANFKGATFNLPVNIWVDGPRDMPHGKRIKIQNNYSTNFTQGDLVSITIEDSPRVSKTFKRVQIKDKDLERVKSWIILNKDALLAYANGDFGTEDLVQKLQPLQD